MVTDGLWFEDLSSHSLANCVMANVQWHNLIQRSLTSLPENFLLICIGWTSTDNLFAKCCTLEYAMYYLVTTCKQYYRVRANRVMSWNAWHNHCETVSWAGMQSHCVFVFLRVRHLRLGAEATLSNKQMLQKSSGFFKHYLEVSRGESLRTGIRTQALVLFRSEGWYNY